MPEIYVYAAGDRWSENSSWNDVGGLALRGALKDDMDETSYTAPAVLHWTDESGLSTGLAAYLEQERNTTDHIASLWVQIAGNGANKVVFEDSEFSGSATCTGAILAPTLQLADVGQPLSVNMSTFRSADPAVNWSLIAGLGALALVVIGGLAVARKRAMGR